MARYRTPLPAMLAAALDTAVNQLLAMDEESPSRLRQLDGRTVLLQLDGVGISLYFVFSAHRVDVRLESAVEPDTVISGTPVALFSMTQPDADGTWGVPGSRVKISGDATLARDLERLFSRLDPDWERRLTGWFGDVIGYQVAAGARDAVRQAKTAAQTLESMTGEYFARPSSPLARAEELREFATAVDTVRDATDRLEARIRNLQQRRASSADDPEAA